jgi:lipopolysaccharide export system protein LptA
MLRFVLFLLLVLFPGSGLGSREAAVPTRIEADTMTYLQEKGEVEFAGHVQVTREDFTLWSKRLVVEFEPGDDAGGQALQTQGSVRKIVATGDVRFEGQGRQGGCDRAVYEDGPGVLTLTGDPWLQEDRNRINGEIIRLYLRENRSEVQGGQKRVEAVFYTQSQNSTLP